MARKSHYCHKGHDLRIAENVNLTRQTRKGLLTEVRQCRLCLEGRPARDTCHRGHPWTEGSYSIMQRKRKGKTYEFRRCRICRRAEPSYTKRGHVPKPQAWQKATVEDCKLKGEAHYYVVPQMTIGMTEQVLTCKKCGSTKNAPVELVPKNEKNVLTRKRNDIALRPRRETQRS